MHVSVDNVANGETIYQRCILIKGKCFQPPVLENDFVSVSTTDSAGSTVFPVQTWPVMGGRFKALVLLSPGANLITLQHYQQNKACGSCKLSLNYVPLLQNPPLYLAIMVAKDSPLTIDCPMVKMGGISTAHSSLDAAIVKFRMTAYMWQAAMGDDMHSKGLGRRSFRLEEEWAADTLSRAFPHASSMEALSFNNTEQELRSTAKIHIVRSDKTVAELRQAQWAQHDPTHRKGDLRNIFVSALKRYGAPFHSAANPVVAGLILDSTYCPSRDLILAHAATGIYSQSGISLGMFGSHLAYSWPRFVEEIPATLMDITPPGDNVAHNCGRRNVMWESCAIGQSFFWQKVGFAFGASSNNNVIARDYAQHWSQQFLPRILPSASQRQDGGDAIDANSIARWALQDALILKLLPHFRLTTDVSVTRKQINALPIAQIEADGDTSTTLVITSDVGIVSIEFNSIVQDAPSVQAPMSHLRISLSELESRFERSKPLELRVLGINGKEYFNRNVWKLFSSTSMVRVPGSNVVLKKRAVSDDAHHSYESEPTDDQWHWAVLLEERGKDGKLVPATSIDMRIGCVLDGAIVHFEDRHTSPCGPRWNKSGLHHHFGGHASQRIYLSPGVDVVKLELTLAWSQFQGMRITLSDGTVKGELNARHKTDVLILEPSINERIIGFYGHSDWQNGWGGPHQFGIITVPKDIELPDMVYDLAELKNTDGGTGPRPGRNNIPVPMEGVEPTEEEHEAQEDDEQSKEEEGEGDDEEEGEGDDGVEGEENNEEDEEGGDGDGEVFDTLEGEDFGPPEGLALRPAA